MPDDKNIIGYVTSNNQQNPVPLANIQQRPMLLQMPMMQQMQQTNQMPYPLMFFLFPRIAMFLMTRGDTGLGQKRLGVQNITQMVRDASGRIIEIVEFVR